MDRTKIQWKAIESCLVTMKVSGNVQESRIKSSLINGTVINTLPKSMNAKELRELLFGTTCSACGIHSNEVTMAIHRKDGKSHDSRMLSYVKNLQKLNTTEWTLLCRKCHRHVHWSMDKLGMKWEDFIFNR